jgi:hypothetical protein
LSHADLFHVKDQVPIVVPSTLCYLVLSCGEWEVLVPDRKSIVQLKFRLRKDILRQLERSAKAYDRSVNAEIAHRLEQSFEHQDIITAIKETIASHGSAVVVDPDINPGKPEGGTGHEGPYPQAR